MIYLNIPLDSDLLEGILQNPEVLGELIIALGLPVDLIHRN